MTVRRAAASDEPGWTRVWDESARAGFAELLPPGHRLPQHDAERWQALLAAPEVTMLVAEEDGELVGFTACGESRDADAGPGTGEVRTFFVAAGRRRRGVGRALMAAALADLRERGYAEATVWSFADNERANAFYEAQGFRRDGAERTEPAWAHILEVRYRSRSRSLLDVRIQNVQEVEPFVTLDGSEIREIAGRAVGTTLNQSLAEATVPPGGATTEHFHRETEEIYFFTHGRGRMRLAEAEREIQAGDAVVIAPGMRHKVWATGDEPLRFLCCCAPAYSHEDTVLTE